MLQRIRALRKSGNDDGFTLTELLIVLVILGVLAGIVVFAIGSFNDNGEKVACAADKKSVETAAEAYFASHNHVYPDTLQKLVDANLLKEVPAGKGYTVTLEAGTGKVTAKLTGGADC